jgi:RNA polymerase sigma factor (TIGR02999 family)
MNDVTRVLTAIEQGDPHAAEQLLPLVYDELGKLAAQKLAQEKPGQTLQATALVHEAYPRLVNVEPAQPWNSRGHFFAAAAEAMRRILVENARRKKSQKHGGNYQPIQLAAMELASPGRSDDLLLLDDAPDGSGAPGRRRGPGRQAAPLRRAVDGTNRSGAWHLARNRLPPLDLRPRLAARPAPRRRRTRRFGKILTLAETNRACFSHCLIEGPARG